MELSTLAIVWIVFRIISAIFPVVVIRRMTVSHSLLKSIIIIQLATISTICEIAIISAMGWKGMVAFLTIEAAMYAAVYMGIVMFLEKMSQDEKNKKIEEVGDNNEKI